MSRRKARAANKQTVVAYAPCRVDLAGGTLDIWPLYLFHPGAMTVNFAINVLARCRVVPLTGKQIRLKAIDTRQEEEFPDFEALCRAKKLRHPLAANVVRFFAPDGGIMVETNSESPAGAGISGSSALMVATISALARYIRHKISREGIRVLAQNLEAELIGVPTGCQDYFPALYGGVNAIELDAGGIHRQAIPAPAEEIDSRFVLVYTGAPRRSGINNWKVFQSHINGDRKIWRNFERLASIAGCMRQALVEGDWKSVARFLREDWMLRRKNAPGISTPLIERLMQVAMKSGAQAGKVCGAGGGGCVVFICEPQAREQV